MAINSTSISGNLGRDAELRRTQTGMAVANFTVAVTDGKKNQQTGEWEKVTHWIPCVMFGARAEKLAPSLEKGAKVAVSGRLRESRWEKNGEARSRLELVVDELEFMSKRQGGQPKRQEPEYVEASVYDSEIPF